MFYLSYKYEWISNWNDTKYSKNDTIPSLKLPSVLILTSWDRWEPGNSFFNVAIEGKKSLLAVLLLENLLSWPSCSETFASVHFKVHTNIATWMITVNLQSSVCLATLLNWRLRAALCLFYVLTNQLNCF